MAVSFQGKSRFVRQFIAAVQGAAKAAVDASTGSITLAFGQAVTGAALWLQALIVQVLMLTRATTSFKSDLDSFCADYFYYRAAATLTTGTETFSRATPTLQALVAVGQMISTGPGGPQYVVTQDTTNAAWSPTLNGYVLAPTVASITVPISATAAGSAGNVQANTIQSFVTPIPGVDAVTNADPLVNGLDQQSDAAFLAGFQAYIQSLSKGTVLAIKTAVAAIQQNLMCQVLENVRPDLSTDNGFLTVVVDDGTGYPTSPVLTAAGAAIDATRAAGIRFAAVAPAVTMAVITLTVVSKVSAQHSADQLAAQTAILDYVNTLPGGATLVWARIYQMAFDSSPNITGVNTILVNSGTADITVPANGVIKTTSVTVA